MFKNRTLSLALIVALLFPMMMVEGVIAQSWNKHVSAAAPDGHSHANGSDHEHESTALAGSDGTGGSTPEQACHHLSAEGACSAHCSSNSCTSVYAEFENDFYFRPNTLRSAAPSLALPDPILDSIHRPPLKTA